MALTIDISPENIDEMIRDSLIKAGLGNRISKAVADSFGGYNSPIDSAIKSYVGEIAADLIRKRFDEQIRAAVADVIEKRVTNELINKMAEEAGNKLIRAVDGY